MRTKVASFFIFFQELSNKKIKALRPKMTKIASRGSCLNMILDDQQLLTHSANVRGQFLPVWLQKLRF